MRLSPSEILQFMGLVVPSEGIEVDAREASVHIAIVTLIGRKIRTLTLSDAELAGLSMAVAVMTKEWRGHSVNELSADPELMRRCICDMLHEHYKFVAEPCPTPEPEQR